MIPPPITLGGKKLKVINVKKHGISIEKRKKAKEKKKP